MRRAIVSLVLVATALCVVSCSQPSKEGSAVLFVATALCVVSCSQPSKEGSAVLLPVPDDPTVSFTVWFKVGSQNDPPGKEGLAWLVGRMIAEGSTGSSSYEEILEKLYPLASSYGVRVDKEMTTLTGRTHRDNLDAYLALFTAAFLEPAFEESDFERVQSDTINFIENSLRYASDEELGKAALQDALFRGSRYAHPPQGTVQGLKAITLDDVREFYRTWLTRDNAVVAVGGGCDDALVARLEESLAGLPEGVPGSAPAVDAVPLEGRRVVLVSKPDADASISFGFPIDVRRGEREFYALWLANSWLGEHRNSASHLYQVIREARGMNYGDYSYIEAFPEGGRRSMPPVNVARNNQIFEVWIRTLPNEQAHFALRAAMRELESLVDDGMTPEQFELTRSFLSKYVLHFAETTSARLGYAVDDRFYGIDGEGHLARFRKMMDELTVEEVNAAVKKHLAPDNVMIAIVTGNAEGLAEALAADSPSPVTYTSPKSDEVLAEDEEIAVFPLGIDVERIEILPVEEIFEGRRGA
jgi:zinc protease